MFIKELSMRLFIVIISLLLVPCTAVLATETKVDPTKPPSVIVKQLVEEIKPMNDLELTAVFKRKNTLYAVINGQLFSAGEYLDGINDDLKVEEISPGTVVLRSNDQDGQLTKLSVDNDAQLTKQVVK